MDAERSRIRQATRDVNGALPPAPATPPHRLAPRLPTSFCQAEDGIRDYRVTGVQTCALPISLVAVSIETARSTWNTSPVAPQRARHGRRLHGRSEERRVGKECRSRWSPY